MSAGRIPTTANSPLTAKGDLFTFSTAPARLAVGSDGDTIVADSSAATGLAYKTKGVFNGLTTTGDTIYSSSGTTQSRLGIGSTGQVLTVSGGLPVWATPSGGTPSFKGCSLLNSANQSVSNGTATIATFDTENFDTDGFHSTSSNTGRITIPTGLGGKYLVSFGMKWTGTASSTARVAYLRKNAVSLGDFIFQMSVNAPAIWARSLIVDLAAGDYIYVDIYQESGGSLDFQGTSFMYDVFSCQYLGA